MNDPVASLSVVSLFLHADIVVKGVLLLLLAASVWSWAVIVDKLWRLGAASRSAQRHEGARRDSPFGAGADAGAPAAPETGTRPAWCWRPGGARAGPGAGRPPKPPASGASGSSGRCVSS